MKQNITNCTLISRLSVQHAIDELQVKIEREKKKKNKECAFFAKHSLNLTFIHARMHINKGVNRRRRKNFLLIKFITTSGTCSSALERPAAVKVNEQEQKDREKEIQRE